MITEQNAVSVSNTLLSFQYLLTQALC